MVNFDDNLSLPSSNNINGKLFTKAGHVAWEFHVMFVVNILTVGMAIFQMRCSSWQVSSDKQRHLEQLNSIVTSLSSWDADWSKHFMNLVDSQ